MRKSVWCAERIQDRIQGRMQSKGKTGFKGKAEAGVEPGSNSGIWEVEAGDQELKVIVGYIVSVRPALPTGSSVLKKQKSRMQKGDRCCTG